MAQFSNPKYEYIFHSDSELIDSFLDANDSIKFYTFFDKFFDLLLLRTEKLEDESLDSLTFATYFDMILMQLRAICVEASYRKSNITVQNYLSTILNTKGIDVLNNYLSSDINGSFGEDEATEDITLRDAIKLITDKQIAHYDDPTQEIVFLIDEIKSIFLNPKCDFYICNVVETLEKIILGYSMEKYQDIIDKYVKRGSDFFRSQASIHHYSRGMQHKPVDERGRILFSPAPFLLCRYIPKIVQLVLA